jgi:hypothetical protein
VDSAAHAEGVDETLPAERGAGGVDEREVVADAAIGDEEPVPRDPTAGDGLEPAADRAEFRAMPRRPPELQPGVAEALGVRVLPAEQEVPLHPLLGVGVGLDPVRGQVAVEQEGQQQGEHLRLARAVVPAQQQAPIVEPELLDVVVEEVDEPGPQRLPAAAARLGKLGAPHASSGSPTQ